MIDYTKLTKPIKKALVEVLRKYDLDKSSIVSEAKFVIKGDKMIIMMPKHATYVDSGRKPGSMPPVEAIRKYMIKKRIFAPVGITQTELAYAIAKSIEKRGIKPKPFLENLQIQLQPLFDKFTQKELEKHILKQLKL